MTFIITEPCVDIKDGECLVVCPVDCIYIGGRMMYIQPDECVNCAICVSVCPVDAIFSPDKLPEKYAHYAAINRDFFAPHVTGWGEPGGFDDDEFKSELDEPYVAALPPQDV